MAAFRDGFGSFTIRNAGVHPRSACWRSMLAGVALSMLSILAPGTASAQALASEADTRAKLDDHLAGQGDRSLGDMVDMYSGALSFTQTDVSIPGNSKLSVSVSRRFDPTRERTLDGASSRLDFYDWALDLPKITVTTATPAPWPSNRCSSLWVPPNVSIPAGPQTRYFQGSDYSAGFKIEFPGGSAQMLRPTTNTFARPSNFVWVASGNIGVSCTNTAVNTNGSSAGEGYVVWLPDGTRYEMTLHTVARAYSVPVLDFPGDTAPPPPVGRNVESMLVTRAIDRFGNTVSYQYDANGRLTGISGSDGRSLAIYWTTYNGSTVIDRVTDGVRTWRYGYANNELATVTRPDGSQWRYSLAALAAIDTTNENAPLGFTGTVTSPYGLTGTFTLGFQYHPYAIVPSGPIEFLVPSIVSKRLDGPGIASQTWNYAYALPAYSGTTPQTKTISVTDPTGTITRSTYNVTFDWREGQLEKTDVFAAGATTPSATTTFTYAQMPVIGLSGISRTNSARVADGRRMTSMTMTVNGDTYTKTIDAIDSYRNPTQETESNSFGPSRTLTMSYQNNTAGTPWVIGAMTSMSVNGINAAQMTLDANLQPQSQYTFGLFKGSATYVTTGTAVGLPQTMTDALNRATTLSDYYRGMPRTMTLADGNTMQLVINPSGSVASMTDPRGNTTAMTYDVLDRPTSVTYPTADTVAWTGSNTSYTTLTAAELGQPVGTFRARTTQGAHQTSLYYDAMLRPVLMEDRDVTTGTSIYLRMAYDPLGRVSFQSYPASNYATTAGVYMYYDALGRMTSEQTSDGITLMRLAYLSNNQMQVTDADGKIVTTRYQAFAAPEYKNATVISAAEGQTTTISRDVFGKIASVTQGGLGYSQTRSTYYDAYQRQCKQVDPEFGATLWGYDAASQMVWQARGQSASAACTATPPTGATTMTYDVRGRVTAVHYPDTTGDVSYTYDAAGNRLSVSNPTATWTYRYNKRNLLEQETAQIDGNSYSLVTAYNALGQTSSQTYPDNRAIALSPDAFGRPTQLGSYVSAVSYHPSGPVSSYTMGNQVRYSQTLDNLQRVFEQKLIGTAGTLQDLQYRYSNGGDLQSLTDLVDGADSASFTYDNLHRIKTASGVWGNYSYYYDPLNNLRSRTGGAGTVSYTYDALNRLSGVSGVSGAVGRSYRYDAKGAVLSDGTRTFSVNSDDQITAIGAIRYGYDGNGKRIKTTQADGSIEYTLYDASGRLYASIRPSASQTTDYLGDRSQTLVELTNGVATYLHADQLGSPRMATSATQAILWREHFDPYGQKQNGTSEKIGYTGHAYDADTQLTYAQARYYDPQVGRFLSNDPVGFTGSPFTFNRYAYGNNNPYSYTDPTGMTNCDKTTGSNICGGDAGVTVNSSPGAGYGAGEGKKLYAMLDAQARGPGLSDAGGSGGGTYQKIKDMLDGTTTLKLGNYFKAKISSDGTLGLSANSPNLEFSIDSNGNSVGQVGPVTFDTSDFGQVLNSVGLKVAGAKATLYNFSRNNVDFKVTATFSYKMLGFDVGRALGPFTFSGSFNPNPVDAVLNLSGPLGGAARSLRDAGGNLDNAINCQTNGDC